MKTFKFRIYQKVAQWDYDEYHIEATSYKKALSEAMKLFNCEEFEEPVESDTVDDINALEPNENGGDSTRELYLLVKSPNPNEHWEDEKLVKGNGI